MFVRRLLLLNPLPTDGGGQLQSSQTPAPEPQGPAKGSPERMPVSPPSSQGVRDFSFNGNEPVADSLNPQVPNQGQVQSGPQAGGQRPAPVPTDPNLAPNTQSQTATQQQWQSIRDAAGGLGFRFPQHIQDDGSALQYMIHRLQERDHYAQLGQRLAPEAANIQAYLAQQQRPGQPGAQQQAPARKAWEAPEFDKRWLSLVEQDPATGVILAKPGVSPTVAEKVQAYIDWKEKYDANPSAVMNEMVREAAREEASKLYQRQFQEQQTQGAAREIVRQNAAWFYAKDQAGNPVLDWQGNPTPSPTGLAYLRHLQTARSYGITDPRHQDQFAKQAIQNQWYAAQAQQQQQQAQANSPAATFAAQSHNTNPMAALSPQSRANQPGNVEADVEDDLALLKQSMRANIKAAGITDEDFRRQATFAE